MGGNSSEFGDSSKFGATDNQDGAGAGAGRPEADGTGPAPYESAGESAGADTYTAGAGADASAGGAPPGLEPLGLVAGSDPARLTAEVEAAVGAAGASAGDPAGVAPAVAGAASWAALTPPTVKVLCCIVLPAWEISEAEQAELAPALADCLEQVFPGGIEGRYACWIRLIVACGAITVSRVAQNGGRLPPLFLTKQQAALRGKADSSSPAPVAPPAKSDAPLRPEHLTSLGV